MARAPTSSAGRCVRPAVGALTVAVVTRRCVLVCSCARVPQTLLDACVAGNVADTQALSVSAQHRASLARDFMRTLPASVAVPSNFDVASLARGVPTSLLAAVPVAQTLLARRAWARAVVTCLRGGVAMQGPMQVRACARA